MLDQTDHRQESPDNGTEPRRGWLFAVGEDRIRRWILLPLGVALLISAAITVFANHRIHHLHITREADLGLQGVRTLMPTLLAKDAALLAALVDGLATCPLFQQAWRTGSRSGLAARVSPFFAALEAEHELLDLTFLRQDQTVFLRLPNQPAQETAPDNRLLARAAAAGQPVHGLEFDPAGRLSLRLVLPLRINGRFAGFADLRREVHGLAAALRQAVGSDIWFAAPKEGLDRERWLQWTGPERAADWDRFPHALVIAGSRPDIPPALNAFISRTHEEHASKLFTTADQGWTLQGGHVPLLDAENQELGEVFLLQDSSALVAALSRLRLVFMGSLGLTAALVFIFLYHFLGNVQTRLSSRRAALLSEIETRRQTETALQGLRQDLERQVAERTSALTNANQTLHREIHDRLRAEENARTAWLDLQQIFNASGSGMIIHNVHCIVTSANQTAALLLGRALPEIIGRKCHALFSCASAGTQQCCAQLIQAGTERVEWEAQVTRSDGQTAWLLVSSAPLRDAAGEIAGMVQSFQDITRRKLAEEKLREAKEEWEQTFNAMGDIVTLQDQDLRIVRANEAAAEVLGLAVENLIGRFCHEVFRGSSEPCLGCPELQALGTCRPHTGEITHPGLGKTFLVSASPILGPDGSCRALVHVAKDITAHKKFEAQLQQIRKMEAIGTLAAGVAHDFNNILTGVLGYSELILQDAEPHSSVRQDAIQIKELGRRGADLTRQLLAFSRKGHMDTRPVDLNQLLNNLMKMLGRLLGEDIDIKFSPAADLVLIRADQAQMEQVVLNLAVNARDAMPSGGTLTIETSNVMLDDLEAARHPGMHPGPHVLLAVSDTGIGMDRETQEHIFEPFFTTKEVGHGTGLGLATVYGIIQQHLGTVWVSSEPDQGSIFRILLPQSADQLSESSRQAAPDLPRGQETVLLVEDEETVRNMLGRNLTGLGYTVLAARNAGEAEALLTGRAEPVDLLFTDVIMPGSNGIELYRRLEAHRPGLRVLFMSGYNEAIMRQKKMNFSAMPFIQKPFTITKVAGAVRRALDE